MSAFTERRAAIRRPNGLGRFGWLHGSPVGAREILAACTGLVGVLLAYLLVHHGFVLACLPIVLVLAVWIVLRPRLSFAVATILILCLPYYQTLGTGRLNVLRASSLLAIVAALTGKGRRRLTAVDGALALLVAATVLSWKLQYNDPKAGGVIIDEMSPLGLYIGARVVTRADVRKLVVLVLGAGTLGALTVIYEYLVGSDVFKDPITYQWNATSSTIFRPGGIFASPPAASTVMCVVILLGIAALGQLAGRWKVAGVICLGICGLALTLTFTRAGLIGLGVGALMCGVLVRPSWLRPTRVLWVAILAGVVVWAVLPALERTTTFQEGLLRGGTLTQREGYWGNALPVMTSSLHNFLTGIGAGALEVPALSPSAPVASVVGVRPESLTTSLHNQYVTTGVEQGVIGLLILLAFLGAASWRAARVAWITRDICDAAIAASVLAVAIVMTVNTVLLDGVSFAVLLLAAGLASGVTLDGRDMADVSARTSGPVLDMAQRSRLGHGRG